MRVITADGSQLGVLALRDALAMAQRENLDLVEISPNAQPPVCKIIDFGKFRYEQSKKEKESRKNLHTSKIKELKYHANIEEHDYQTKLRHIEEFLSKGMKVKATLMFRGREIAHKELGEQIMQRVIQDISGFGAVEMPPRLIGKAIHMVLSPKSKHKKPGVEPTTRPPTVGTAPGQPPRPGYNPVQINRDRPEGQSSAGGAGGGFTNTPRFDLDKPKNQGTNQGQG